MAARKASSATGSGSVDASAYAGEPAGERIEPVDGLLGRLDRVLVDLHRRAVVGLQQRHAEGAGVDSSR